MASTSETETETVDLSRYVDRVSLKNKMARAVWGAVWLSLYRPSPRPLHAWRRFLLRRFGAKIGEGAHPYPRAQVWAPWNLEMGAHSCLSDDVRCYSVDRVVLEDHAIVSQNAHLCSASHDYRDRGFPMISAPIHVKRGAWVAADAFVGPGVTVGENAVVGARACVVKDVAPNTVVAGNPARVVRAKRYED